MEDRPQSLLKLPAGYHFAPTDEELIVHYLRRKIDGLPPLLPIFKDEDVVSCRPEKITEKHKDCGEDRWYFFTKRRRKYRRGNRPNRATEDNEFWKATGPQRMIYAGKEEEEEEKRLVGRVRTLVFYEKDKKALSERKTGWTMYEYENLTSEAEAADQNVDKLGEWVLCTIQEQKKKEEGKEGSEEKVQETKGKEQKIEEGSSASEKKVKETKGKETASKKRKAKQEEIEAENITDEDPIHALHLMKVAMLPPHPETFAAEEGYDELGMFDNSFPRKSSPVPAVQQHESPHSETMSPCIIDNDYYDPNMAPTPCLQEPPHSASEIMASTAAGGSYNIGSDGMSSMLPWDESPLSEMIPRACLAANTYGFSPSIVPMPVPQEAPHMKMQYEMTSVSGYTYTTNYIAPNTAAHQHAAFLHPHSAAGPPGAYGYGVGQFGNLLGASSGGCNYADQSATWMNRGAVSSHSLGGYLADSWQYPGGPSVLGQGRAVRPAAARPRQDQVTART